MAKDTVQQSVLLIGKSQVVLDDAVAGLRTLGRKADATNDFTAVTGRFDARTIDLIVFGGQVPPDRKAELTAELAAINPQIIFVQGLAGIPGLIVNQVEGAFTAHEQDPTGAPTYTPADRSIRLTLTEPATVKVTAWWQTSFVPPHPKSDSLLLLEDRLAAGEHAISVPGLVPPKAAFASVQIDNAIYAFTLATETRSRGSECETLASRSRSHEVVSLSINGERVSCRRTRWPKRRRCTCATAMTGARGCIRVAGCRRHSVPRESSTKR